MKTFLYISKAATQQINMQATISFRSNLGQVVYTQFTHIASPVSQLQETGIQKGVFGA